MTKKEISALTNKLYVAMTNCLSGIPMKGEELGKIIAMAVVQIYKDIEEDDPRAEAIYGVELQIKYLREINEKNINEKN